MVLEAKKKEKKKKVSPTPARLKENRATEGKQVGVKDRLELARARARDKGQLRPERIGQEVITGEEAKLREAGQIQNLAMKIMKQQAEEQAPKAAEAIEQVREQKQPNDKIQIGTAEEKILPQEKPQDIIEAIGEAVYGTPTVAGQPLMMGEAPFSFGGFQSAVAGRQLIQAERLRRITKLRKSISAVKVTSSKFLKEATKTVAKWGSIGLLGRWLFAKRGEVSNLQASMGKLEEDYETTVRMVRNNDISIEEAMRDLDELDEALSEYDRGIQQASNTIRFRVASPDKYSIQPAAQLARKLNKRSREAWRVLEEMAATQATQPTEEQLAYNLATELITK